MNLRFKNDILLVPDAKVKLESRLKTIYCLTIDAASLQDAAKYTLNAKNESGEAEESFSLIVQSMKSFFKIFFEKKY